MDFELSVPGAFIDHSVSPVRPSLTTTTARPSSISIFRTPQIPSAASSLSQSYRTMARHRTDSNAGSRKRPRVDSTIQNPSPVQSPRGYFSYSNYDFLSSADPLSPAPLVNTDYRIAGGLDTPTARLEDGVDHDVHDDYRMNRYTAAPESYFHDLHTPALLSREGNGRKRGHEIEMSPRAGWEIGRTVWALTGGVAVKVVNFAWTTGKAFTGFRAGGGKAYQFEGNTPGFADQSWAAIDDKEDVFNSKYRGRSGTPIPGGFPVESYIEDYMTDPHSHQHKREEMATPTSHGEQKQTGSTLKGSESWVFVRQPDGTSSREASPTRKKPRPNGNIARPISRASIATGGSRPRLVQSRPSGTTASFASPRAGTYGNTNSKPRVLEGGHGHVRSRSSIASPRRETLPPSPEVLQFEKKIRRKEKVVDQSMSRLNQQLQDMIREGKEALGTKIEVRDVNSGTYSVDLVEDEGYGEGD